MSVGIGTSWTGVGLLVTANGADDAWAGIATMYYGEHVHTLKYRALYAATGSETVATIGEIGAGLASGALEPPYQSSIIWPNSPNGPNKPAT